jgi:hypothetical protein
VRLSGPTGNLFKLSRLKSEGKLLFRPSFKDHKSLFVPLKIFASLSMIASINV